MTDVERIDLFTERLHKVWKESGLSKGHFAELAGVHRNTLYHIFIDKSIPNGMTIALLCEAYGISADWLLGLDNREKKKGVNF